MRGHIWLKEFGWLQTRGSGNDLLMICKDCTIGWKEECVHEWMQKFPMIDACLSHESGGSQKYGKSIASATTFLAKTESRQALETDYQSKT